MNLRQTLGQLHCNALDDMENLDRQLARGLFTEEEFAWKLLEIGIEFQKELNDAIDMVMQVKNPDPEGPEDH